MTSNLIKTLVYPKNILVLHHNTNKKLFLFYGSFGWVCFRIPSFVGLKIAGNLLFLTAFKRHRDIVGLYAQLVKNMLSDISFGYSMSLQLKGVGYKFRLDHNNLHISLGYSHPIFFTLPPGVKGKILDIKGTSLKLTGICRQFVRTIGACICRFRMPDIYKGKGIRIRGEGIQLKPGKKTYQ
jgi:large subunit ribosomal protein L6